MGSLVMSILGNMLRCSALLIMLLSPVCFGANGSGINVSNAIQYIEVLTATCDDCDIGLFGSIKFRACGTNGCCETGKLDHTWENDFSKGKISVFNDHEIGACGKFDVGQETDGETIKMILNHSGSDGGKFDWAKIYTYMGVYTCHF